ncbi:MAG: hypothetical protein ACJ8AE_10055, partial [Gemmatimonadaceae bacterium]
DRRERGSRGIANPARRDIPRRRKAERVEAWAKDLVMERKRAQAAHDTTPGVTSRKRPRASEGVERDAVI